MKKRIVTISRQNGSGGRYIGEQLGKALNIPCYDEKLMDMVAKESGFALDFVEEKVRGSPEACCSILQAALPMPIMCLPAAARPCRMRSTLYRIGSSRIWRRRNPVSSWEDVQIMFFGTDRTVCMCLL